MNLKPNTPAWALSTLAALLLGVALILYGLAEGRDQHDAEQQWKDEREFAWFDNENGGRCLEITYGNGDHALDCDW